MARRWVSASELGEYAYCPRSHWYSQNNPEPTSSAEELRARESGDRFHARELSRSVRLADRRGAYVAVLLAALVFVGIALAGGR